MNIREACWQHRQDLVDLEFRRYVHADLLSPTKNVSKKPPDGTKVVLVLFIISVVAGILSFVPSRFWTVWYLAFAFGLCALFGASLAIAMVVVRSRRRYIAFWIMAIAIFFVIGWFAP